MGIEIPLQKDMFTQEYVDTRTERQIRADMLKDQPVQQDLFRHIPITEFQAKRTPITGDYRPKLVLIQEKSRTDEQLEEEIDRQALEHTKQMFADDTAGWQLEEAKEVTTDKQDTITAIHQPPENQKEKMYMELVKLVEECASTVEVDTAYGQSLLIRLSLVQAKIKAGILTPEEATAAIQIGKSLAKQAQSEAANQKEELPLPAVSIPVETETDAGDICAGGFRIQQRHKQRQQRVRAKRLLTSIEPSIFNVLSCRMSYRKEQETPLDTSEIEGMYSWDGDLFAKSQGADWARGTKDTRIMFESGREFPLWEAENEEHQAIVHLFGEMDLPYRDTRNKAFERAKDIAHACGYMVKKHGEYELDVTGTVPYEFLRIHYDPIGGHMVNVAFITDEMWHMPVHQAHQLMSDEIRGLLPDMFGEMDKGEDALAPIKYFTPDANWTWYPSEFDGQDIFYGLVIGYEIEYGYFRLSELQDAKGLFGLPIERDLHYEAKPLKELKEYHQKMWEENNPPIPF